MSRHMQVFVDESAEPIPSQVSDGVAYGGGSESPSGWVLIEGSVWEVGDCGVRCSRRGRGRGGGLR